MHGRNTKTDAGLSESARRTDQNDSRQYLRFHDKPN